MSLRIGLTAYDVPVPTVTPPIDQANVGMPSRGQVAPM